MKKLIWRIKYARRLNKYSKCGFWYGWYVSGIHINEHPEDWGDDDPELMADEEMSYWGE